MVPRSRAHVRDVVELVRLPAVLSVPGDVLSGAAAAGRPLHGRTFGLVASSACLYWAGMALNDWADRDLDAHERPERPIPSGRVTPGFALALAAGLTGVGVGAAALAGGRRAVALAVPLAATVWAYDLRIKSSRAGPVAMALARGMDVMLGAGGSPAGVPPALVVAAHTAAVTGLSRTEVEGGRPDVARAAVAATAVITAAVPSACGVGRRGTGTARLLGVGLLAGYAVPLARAQLAAVREPGPTPVRRAVGAGILGLIPLEAALVSTRATRAAAALASLWPLAKGLSRKVSPT